MNPFANPWTWVGLGFLYLGVAVVALVLGHFIGGLYTVLFSVAAFAVGLLVAAEDVEHVGG